MDHLDSEEPRSNRLIHEKSPYLLQHAHNPVNWYPWGEEAFEKAKHENKPVFLSIGYSTCHWCHVMERESFEDEEVASLLNRDFICIKVDREERPDIDHIYMTVCQAMTGQGGWPLTIFMNYDQKPFYAGTYFPKHPRFGHVGLMDLLPKLTQRWRENPEEMGTIGDQVVDFLQKQRAAKQDETENTSQGERVQSPIIHDHGRQDLYTSVIQRAVDAFRASFDQTYGGFGDAPKFPTPHNLMFLLWYGVRSKQSDCVEMVEQTLDAMYQGGIYDHVGFGFCRYSTDEKWLVPHFEKMLYDNALLCMVYAEAYQVTRRERFAQVAKDILEYLRRDMTGPDGEMYSAEDADSEGVEGWFYLWDPEEVIEVLGERDGQAYCEAYDISKQGNFERRSIPNLIDTEDDSYDTTVKQRRWNEQLRMRRESRVRPFRDDKVLTAWNGLVMAALAKAARVFSDQGYGDAAKRVAAFLEDHLRRADGRWMARYRDGDVSHLAYAEDYAFLIWGWLELYETTGEPEWLQRAVQAQHDMDRLFWDEEFAGYFVSGVDAESLIVRPKEVYDGALPSANSVAALNLLRISRLTGQVEFEERASLVLEMSLSQAKRYPSAFSYLMQAVMFASRPTLEVVVAGKPDARDTLQMKALVSDMYLPDAVVVYRPDQDGSEIERVAAYVADQPPVDGKATVYICENFQCRAPLTDERLVQEALTNR